MKRTAALLGVLVLLLSASLAEAGGARGTRPGRGGSGSGSSPRTHATGQATWRHGSAPVRGHDGWYGGWGWGWYGTWGWPGYWYPGPYLYGYPGWGPYGYGYGYPSYVSVIGEAAEGPAVVVTEVRPRKATVRLDGEEIGRARDFDGGWDVLRLEPGRHVLEFQREGYQTLQLHLDAKAGRTYAVRQTLREGQGLDTRSTKEPPAAAPREAARTRTEGRVSRGLLRVDVAPGDAAVYLDGEFLGRADELSALRGAIPVAEGSHRLEIVRPGRRSEVREVEVSGREPVRVELELEPDGGDQ